MPDVLVDHDAALDVIVEREVDVLVEELAPEETIITECEQGPPGPPGPPGLDAIAVGGALSVVNRLAEYAGDTSAQAEVQTNIGLGAVDPLAYYILAKA